MPPLGFVSTQRFVSFLVCETCPPSSANVLHNCGPYMLAVLRDAMRLVCRDIYRQVFVAVARAAVCFPAFCLCSVGPAGPQCVWKRQVASCTGGVLYGISFVL